MTLQDQLTADMKDAMKARDSARLSVIRMLLADIKKAAIDQRKDMTPDDELTFLSTQAKRRRESIDAYVQGGREDLADTERAELVVIEAYLPQPFTADEVEAMAREIAAQTGATGPGDRAKVLPLLMPRLKGRFNAKEAGPILDRVLGGG
jgi:uncharacterized protein YqeY